VRLGIAIFCGDYSWYSQLAARSCVLFK